MSRPPAQRLADILAACDVIDAHLGRGPADDPLADGQEVTASITKEAVEELGLAAGTAVTVLVKSTEVMLAVD